jgi:hypothetical protein
MLFSFRMIVNFMRVIMGVGVMQTVLISKVKVVISRWFNFMPVFSVIEQIFRRLEE